MDLNRIHSILNNKEKIDVLYNERPVWIQGVNENIAKVGFVDTFEERDVFIEDLYERNLYNQFKNAKVLILLSAFAFFIYFLCF